MKNISYLIIVVWISMLTACNTINTVYFERLEAADVSFPEVVRRVGIINNMPTMEGDESDWANAAGVLEGDGRIIAETLAQEIASTRYFDEVVIYDSAVCEMNVSLKERQMLKEEWPGHILSKEEADKWIGELGVDMILSIERARIQLKEGTEWSDMMVSVPVMNAVIRPVLRAYVPSRENPFLAIAQKDTIFWHLTNSLTYKQIIKESSEYAASMLLPYLLPYWKETGRNYFDGGSVEMRDAGVHVREHNWEAAYPLWRKVYETQKGRKKMRAAYNLALYYEIQGDFEQANEYIEIASDLAKDDSTDAMLVRVYQVQLGELAKKNQRLRIQMNRFENKK